MSLCYHLTAGAKSLRTEPRSVSSRNRLYPLLTLAKIPDRVNDSTPATPELIDWVHHGVHLDLLLSSPAMRRVHISPRRRRVGGGLCYCESPPSRRE